MVTRIGGLASGMDIDALVNKLMTAERSPLNKLLQNKQRYEWQRDAYRDVNKKLKAFDTYIADNFVVKNLNSKTASSSNSDLVSAVATSKAGGTLSIEGVSQLAEAARITGGQINATGSTQMSKLASGPITLKAPNGKEIEIDITPDMTVNDFVEQVNKKNAGVTAVFENGRFSFTAKDTGKGKIEITGNVADMNISGQDMSKEGKNAIFQINGIATERSSNTFSFNGYNITLKSKFNESTTQIGFNEAAQENLTNAKTNLEDLYNKLATKYRVTFNIGDNYDTQFNAIMNEIETETTSRQAKVDSAKSALDTSRNVPSAAVQALSDDAKKFINSLSEKQKVALAAKDFSKDSLEDLGLTQEQMDTFQALSKDDKAAIDALSKEELTQTAGKVYDALSADTKKALLSSKSLAELKADTTLSQADQDILAHLTEEDYKAIKDVGTKTGELALANTELADANSDKANLTGMKNTYDDAKNTVDNAAQPPADTVTTTPVKLTSTTNVDEMMDKIKEFVNTYNGLIKDFKDQTTQTKYRDYAPLTPEQKESMKENEIKLWEEKAKSGLLRSDSLLRNGLSKMRSLVYEPVPGLEDSKFNTLFSIGITTTKNYNDGGTLEIDEKKLRKALEEDPDAVANLFRNDSGKEKDVTKDGKVVDTRGYLANLRSSMKEFEVSIEQKAGRSSMTDSQYTLGKNLRDVDTRISTWQDKLKNVEARYWKQFTAMEQAINKANQQSSQLMKG
ncbi:flagellar filament capping protein FliD [Lysinibacillus sp. NPDC094403]|uniref:flagellar filament capping protein FliD n=1 Tax=Lysinibacillus sp. NPDC094403 TaxID=3390581 RepID=UPI003D042F21